MKLLTLIIIFLFSFAKTKVGIPIISSSKIVVSPSININCTVGTIQVCHDSEHRLCHCKIDFDSNPLKTAKKFTNGTNLQWLENSKKFTPICMKIYDPKKPLGCPVGYRLTNYKSNSSILVPYCTKYLTYEYERIPFGTNFTKSKKLHGGNTKNKVIHRSKNIYLLSHEAKIRLGYTHNKTTAIKIIKNKK